MPWPRTFATQELRVLARLWLVCAAPACLDWDELQTGRCGDGFTGPEETCDDGNRTAGDGCSERCQVEPPRCGDERTDEGETCDDGNQTPGDGCSERCQVEPPRCGDERMDEGETCDDGNQTPGDGCSERCQMEEEPPPAPRCGDGVLDDDEACDDGNTASDDACLKGCSRATCGDGFTRANVEECDVSSTPAGTPCSVACLACGTEPESFFRPGNQHCFTRHTELVSQAEARARCQEEGGDLWTVTTQDEGELAVARMMLTGRLWLGLEIEAGAPRWVTGESYGFESFAEGEPTATSPACAAFASGTGAFQTSDCEVRLGYVCERVAAFVSVAENHAYKVRTRSVSADQARTLCAEEGGALVSLETETERAFVAGRLNVRVWVDARESETPGTFEWADGSAVDPVQFRPGQPDDADDLDNCLVLEPKRKLSDEPCAQPNAYVCEFD